MKLFIMQISATATFSFQILSSMSCTEVYQWRIKVEMGWKCYRRRRYDIPILSHVGVTNEWV
jgi:hypothetical protein